MTSLTSSGLIILLLPTQAAPGVPTPVQNAARPEAKQQIITVTAAAYTIYLNQEPRQALVRSTQPILRFDDAVTLSQHGEVYLWSENNRRPLAIGSFYFQADGARVDEFQSLTTVERLTGEYAGEAVWNPTSLGIEFKKLNDEGDVPTSEVRRLNAMRNIARRFSATVTDRRAGRLELRLLTQPIYRYTDEEHKILDGTLFGFAKGTNPEVLLLLEARPQNGVDTWHYALARMTARGCNVTLDEHQIWALPAVGYKQDATQPYFNRYTR